MQLGAITSQVYFISGGDRVLMTPMLFLLFFHLPLFGIPSLALRAFERGERGGVVISISSRFVAKLLCAQSRARRACNAKQRGDKTSTTHLEIC